MEIKTNGCQRQNWWKIPYTQTNVIKILNLLLKCQNNKHLNYRNISFALGINIKINTTQLHLKIKSSGQAGWLSGLALLQPRTWSRRSGIKSHIRFPAWSLLLCILQPHLHTYYVTPLNHSCLSDACLPTHHSLPTTQLKICILRTRTRTWEFSIPSALYRVDVQWMFDDLNWIEGRYLAILLA